MSDTHSDADIKRHVRTYLTVFVTLLGLTLVTVAVFYLHLSVPAAITVALIIATVKASLVATYFMHLISEKKLIYGALAFTLFCFLALLFLPSLEVFSRG